MAGAAGSGAAQSDGFVSYSRSDAAVAAALVQAAAARGRTLWLDTEDLAPGTAWPEELSRAIESADAVVCLLSAAWVGSRECLRELELAVQYGKRLVSVLVEPMAWNVLPVELRPLQWIDATKSTLDEVAREVLSAIDQDHERVREHTRWLERAARWDEGGRDRSLEARGRDLRAAEAWLATAGADPRATPLQIEFVSSSRRGQNRRGRLLLVGVSTAAVVALVLAGVAVWQRQEADAQRREAVAQRREAVAQRNTAEKRRLIAESQRLAVESTAQLSTDPEVALVLASDGYRASPTAQATTALRQSLDASLLRSTLPSADKVLALVPAASGLGVMVTAGQPDTLVAIRGTDILSTLAIGRAVSDLEVTGDGTAGVAIAGHEAVGWRLDGDSLVATARVAHAHLAAASRAGDRWVVLDLQHRLWTYDAAGGLRSQALPPLNDPQVVVLSADGSTVAMGNSERVLVRLPSGAFVSRHIEALDQLYLTGDGQYLVALDGAGQGSVVRVDDGRLTEHLTDTLGAAVGLGSEVAFEGDAGVDVDWLGTKKTVHLARDRLGTSAGSTRRETIDSEMPWTDNNGLFFDRAGDRLLTYDVVGAPRVWDAADGQLLGELLTSRGSVLTGLWFTPAGDSVVTLDDRSTVRGWAVPALPTPLRIRPVRAPGFNRAFSEGGRVVLGSPPAVITSADRNGIHSWSWATSGDVCAGPDRELLALCATEQTANAALPDGGALEAAPSPDGSRLAVLDRNGVVWMYPVDPTAASPPQPLWQTAPARGLQGFELSDPIRWSPDGARLMVDRSRFDVLDAATGAVVPLKETGTQFIATAVWLDSESIGATSLDNTRLQVFSPTTGAAVRRLPSGTAGLAMSNTVGNRLAVDQEVFGDDVSVVDTRDGTRYQILNGVGGEVESVAMSRDGAFVATGEEGGGIHVWETSSGVLVLSTDVGKDVMGVAFDSDHVLYEDDLGTGIRRVDCPSCLAGPELLKLAASHITAPLDDAEAVQFAVTDDQRAG